MTNWPDKPLIRIKRGLKIQEEIRDELAIRNTNGSYMTQKYNLYSTGAYNVIDEWEEVTPVPTAALKRLQGAFRGVDMVSSLVAAVQDVTSHLPADKPSPLDRAVTMVKEAKGAVLHLTEFTPEGRLALLMGDLATLQATDHKVSTLATIARICVEWVNLIAPGYDALSEVKARVESDPGWGGFTIMASLAGDVAVGIDDGMSGGPMKHLLTIAQYALAWAAQAIEEEDAHD